MKYNFVSFLLQFSVFTLSLMGFSTPPADASQIFQIHSQKASLIQPIHRGDADADFSSNQTQTAECELDPEDDFPIVGMQTFFKSTSSTYLATTECFLQSVFLETPIKPPRA